jgi:hypothetical protein
VTNRLTISASVDVRGSASDVFGLVSDLRRKAPLNPNVRVIRVELEGEDPVREGSVFFHRFEKGGQVFEYRTRCVRMIPSVLFESRSCTDPPFDVRVTVEPIEGGCRLTQEETLEVPEAGSLGMLDVLPLFRDLGAAVRDQQREGLRRTLTRELQAWLEAIKVEVEGSRG